MSQISFISPKDLNFINSINIAIVKFPITNFLIFIGKNYRNKYKYYREKYIYIFFTIIFIKIRATKNKN